MDTVESPRIGDDGLLPFVGDGGGEGIPRRTNGKESPSVVRKTLSSFSSFPSNVSTLSASSSLSSSWCWDVSSLSTRGLWAGGNCSGDIDFRTELLAVVLYTLADPLSVVGRCSKFTVICGWDKVLLPFRLKVDSRLRRQCSDLDDSVLTAPPVAAVSLSLASFRWPSAVEKSSTASAPSHLATRTCAIVPSASCVAEWTLRSATSSPCRSTGSDSTIMRPVLEHREGDSTCMCCGGHEPVKDTAAERLKLPR